jgi:rifampicin phosphotransferase
MARSESPSPSVASRERPPLADAMPFTVDLADVGMADRATVGGKAANLGELLRAHFNVPPGFVVTTAAYDAVLAANAPLLVPFRPGKGERTDLDERLLHAAIPADVEAAILAAYRELGTGPVAVRSSATAEDLPGAAFAGQQDTILGVVDAQGLMTAIRRCWASLWSERAVSYRRQHGFDHADVKLAAIVQRLIAADAAGVMFTANPVTGARDETVIDASSGLGEAIVAGLVTPDHVVLRRTWRGWKIVARQLGRREVEVRASPSGGTVHLAGSPPDRPVLPDKAFRRLASVGAAVADHFGGPQDIEWAVAGGELFILQSRPITALPAPPARRGRANPMRFTPAEYFQIRPYPLDMTTWTGAMMEVLPRMLPVPRSMFRFDQFLLDDDGVVTGLAGWPALALTPGLLFVPFRFLFLAARYDPALWRDDPLLVSYREQLEELAAREPRSLTWPELLGTVREVLAPPAIVIELRRRYLPRPLLAAGALRLVLGLLGVADRFGVLLSGADNVTLETNRKLEDLAATIRATPMLTAAFACHDPGSLPVAMRETAEGRAFLAALDAFLAAYGHRETGSPLLVSQPTWAESPEVVLAVLQGLARAELPLREGRLAWQAARDELIALPALRWAPVRALVLVLLGEARRFLPLREDTHFLLTMPLPVLRGLLLELGRRLAEVGVLGEAEDVFHLRLDELERVSERWPPPVDVADRLRSTLARRAARRAALANVPLFDAATAPPPGDALAAGSPGSPGTAVGRVRVVLDASAFGTLQPGEVLVAPYTNPSWTPLFTRAAAVVVDTGSAVSHAAIVAREYGIPAVMATGDGTRQLRDGQRVRVDGSRGLVFPAPEPLPPGEDAAPGVAVDADRQDEDGAGGDRLPERGDAIKIEGVGDQAEEEDAENRSGPSAAE